MADLLATYLANASKAHIDAGEAVLQNVKERHLRAASAWEKMADRVERTNLAREKREAVGDPTLIE